MEMSIYILEDWSNSNVIPKWLFFMIPLLELLLDSVAPFWNIYYHGKISTSEAEFGFGEEEAKKLFRSKFSEFFGLQIKRS